MRNLEILSRDKGMSLVGTLVAVALTGVVAVSMSSLMLGLVKGQNRVRYRTQADNFTEEVRSELSSRQACTNTFGGLSLTSRANHSVTRIRGATGSVKYDGNDRLGDGTLRIQSMRLTGYSDDVAPTGWAQLEMVLESLKDTNGLPVVVRKIRIKTEKSSSNRLTGCVALAKMSDGIWQRAPANQDDIFFDQVASGGRVGIGTSSPQAELHVQTSLNSAVLIRDGNLELQRNPPSSGAAPSTGGHIDLKKSAADDFRVRIEYRDDVGTGSQGGLAITTSTDGTLAGSHPRVTVARNGNVGIGNTAPQAKLHVSGGEIRGRLDCRRVQDVDSSGAAFARCDDDEYVIGGGANCSSSSSSVGGFIHVSRPNSGLTGWEADCFRHDWAAEVQTTAYAICCRY